MSGGNKRSYVLKQTCSRQSRLGYTTADECLNVHEQVEKVEKNESSLVLAYDSPGEKPGEKK